MILGTFLFLSSLNVSSSQAAITTFNVDLRGTGNLGNQMAVFGTFTLNPSLPVGSAITMSDLRYQYRTGPSVAFPSLPTIEGAATTALQWNVVGNSLYINRFTEAASRLRWDSPGQTLWFSAGPISHLVMDLTNAESFILKPPSDRDGPTGSLVGTAAVPEPTTVGFLSVLGAAASMRRSRPRQGGPF